MLESVHKLIFCGPDLALCSPLDPLNTN